MRGEHWLLLAGLFALLGTLEDSVTTWADLANVKIVLKFIGAAGLLIRASFVPPSPPRD